jgi:hypothetical protein
LEYRQDSKLISSFPKVQGTIQEPTPFSPICQKDNVKQGIAYLLPEPQDLVGELW